MVRRENTGITGRGFWSFHTHVKRKNANGKYFRWAIKKMAESASSPFSI